MIQQKICLNFGQEKAHNARMKVFSKIVINKSVNEIINLIKSPNNLEKFHPFCKTNTIDVWNEYNKIDYVNYYSGKSYKRQFTNINANGYTLDVYEDRKLATITWTVASINNKSFIEITADLNMPYSLRIINLIIFHVYVKHVMKRYLNAVTKGLKMYMETKEIIQEDQFGKHIWYSAY